MKYRKFGNTELNVSEIGFGAWGIGGPAMAGDFPIGWGNVDDDTSVAALFKARDLGVNFFDTADFYGLGHSEELIGRVFGNSGDIIVASKVGHRLADDQTIVFDYSRDYIISACNKSLKRLNREAIDYYQLHTAKVSHLMETGCVEAMEELKQSGKIRYWGISLNTFNPFPEYDYFINNKLGSGFQIVFNALNQRALSIVRNAHKLGFGIIARMPLQFGLLTGKFNKNTKFGSDDHRSFRLTPEILSVTLPLLEPLWAIAERYGISKTSFALSYILSYAGISTTIPGIKTPGQAEFNTKDIIRLENEDIEELERRGTEDFGGLIGLMEKQG